MVDAGTTDQLTDWLALQRPALFRYCARVTGSISDGEDAVQDTLLKTVQTFPGFGVLADPKAWLYRVAHNAAIDILRARQRAPQVLGDELAEAVADPAAAGDARWVARPQRDRACTPVPPLTVSTGTRASAGSATCASSASSACTTPRPRPRLPPTTSTRRPCIELVMSPPALRRSTPPRRPAEPKGCGALRSLVSAVAALPTSRRTRAAAVRMPARARYDRGALARVLSLNPELDRLLAQLEPSSPANQAHRLAFGLLCARRVEHLLEDAEVIDLLRKFESAMAAAASAEAVAPWAARARELAQQHRGSPSLDGVDHAAVSATQACASAMSGRARDAATHGAYARVYGQGGDGAVSDPRALEPEYAWMAGELQHLLQQGKVVSSAAAAAQVACTLRDPAPGDLAWIVHRQTVLYAQAQGWNNEFEALASEIVARFIRSYDPAWERCWVAHAQEQIVGSVFLVRQGPHTAQLRMLYVEPSARGTGIGGMLVAACLDFARQVGYRRMMLWTNSVLTDARRLYQRTGFQLEGEESHHSFGQDLVGQIWGRDL